MIYLDVRGNYGHFIPGVTSRSKSVFVKLYALKSLERFAPGKGMRFTLRNVSCWRLNRRTQLEQTTTPTVTITWTQLEQTTTPTVTVTLDSAGTNNNTYSNCYIGLSWNKQQHLQ